MKTKLFLMKIYLKQIWNTLYKENGLEKMVQKKWFRKNGLEKMVKKLLQLLKIDFEYS